MRVAILQPHYLPYSGMFGIIDSVDLFIFYDDVQFSPQSWQQRNKIKTLQGVKWLSVPVRFHLGDNIKDVLVDGVKWRKKHLETIKQSYSKAPKFEEFRHILKVYEEQWTHLNNLNQYLICLLCANLKLNLPKFISSSDLGHEGAKTDRVVSVLRQVKATEYVSGMAGRNYLEKKKFGDIKLKWFDYHHPEYPQRGSFVPYLSIIDMLFNADNPLELIRAGVNIAD